MVFYRWQNLTNLLIFNNFQKGGLLIFLSINTRRLSIGWCQGIAILKICACFAPTI